jgi:prepilin-type N-terminal cleavage/methylation domain-containing protein
MVVRVNRRRSSRTAFTLVEILIVVAIIVVLAAIAVPITMSVRDSAFRDIARAQCKGTLSQAVESFRLDSEVNPEGGIPSSWNEVLQSPKAGLKPDTLKDPWGREYHLVVPSQHGNPAGYDIFSDCGGGEAVGNW